MLPRISGQSTNSGNESISRTGQPMNSHSPNFNGLCSTRGAGGLRFQGGRASGPRVAWNCATTPAPSIALLAVFTGKENLTQLNKTTEGNAIQRPLLQERQREKKRIAASLSLAITSLSCISSFYSHLLQRAGIY